MRTGETLTLGPGANPCPSASLTARTFPLAYATSNYGRPRVMHPDALCRLTGRSC
jgi:hypothetical protein